MMRTALVVGVTLFPFLVGASLPIVGAGQSVYAEKKCSLCHEIDGKGGKFGGDLSHVGSKREGAWLKRFMRDPMTLKPAAKMKPFTGTNDELEALVAYLRSLK